MARATIRAGRKELEKGDDDLGYSLHALRKNREGTEHSDRNAQFEYISAMEEDFR